MLKTTRRLTALCMTSLNTDSTGSLTQGLFSTLAGAQEPVLMAFRKARQTFKSCKSGIKFLVWGCVFWTFGG